MFNIENARPTAKKILGHIEEFERFCMGQSKLSPSRFRELNAELSIGSVLMIGKRRYEKNPTGKHLIWRGLDNQEHDLGPIHNTNVMRDYPGFHGKRSLSLGNDMVVESKIIHIPGMRGNLTVVTLQDGSVGIAPDYRMALRNACLKMHLKNTFNTMSLSSLWNSLWLGHA